MHGIFDESTQYSCPAAGRLFLLSEPTMSASAATREPENKQERCRRRMERLVCAQHGHSPNGVQVSCVKIEMNRNEQISTNRGQGGTGERVAERRQCESHGRTRVTPNANPDRMDGDTESNPHVRWCGRGDGRNPVTSTRFGVIYSLGESIHCIADSPAISGTKIYCKSLLRLSILSIAFSVCGRSS